MVSRRKRHLATRPSRPTEITGSNVRNNMYYRLLYLHLESAQPPCTYDRNAAVSNALQSNEIFENYFQQLLVRL